MNLSRGEDLILATGRHGSIGRSLPENVFGLKSRLEAAEAEMSVELKKFEDPRALVHLAAMTNVAECEKNPELAFEMNVQGARRWLKASAKVGVKRFVYVSSAHVFRPCSELIRLTPNDSTNAVSVYGRSKVEAEKALIAEADSLGIELSIARVFSVVAAPGKHLRRGYLHAELQRRATEKDFSPVLGYKNVRDFIDTDTIAAELKTLAIDKQLIPIAHICTGNGMTVRELTEKVFSEAGIARDQMSSMFPENNDRADYLVGEPTVLKGLK